MTNEEIKIVKKAVKDYLGTLAIHKGCPWDDAGKVFSDKKYIKIEKEIVICKKLLKKFKIKK